MGEKELMDVIDVQNGALMAYEEVLNQMAQLSSAVSAVRSGDYRNLYHIAALAKLCITSSGGDNNVIQVCKNVIFSAGIPLSDISVHDDGKISGRFNAVLNEEDKPVALRLV